MTSTLRHAAFLLFSLLVFGVVPRSALAESSPEQQPPIAAQ